MPRDCSACDAVGFGVIARDRHDDRVLCRSCDRELAGEVRPRRNAPLFGDAFDLADADPEAAPAITFHGGGVTD